MATYPNSIPDVRSAIQSYGTPPAEAADKFFAVLDKLAPVDQFVGAFDALKDHVDNLDAAGLRLLCGVSELIFRNAYYQASGKPDEALRIRDRVLPMLPADPDFAPRPGPPI